MDNKKPSAIDMRLEYNGDKTHVIMEANAEHDYSIRWLIEMLYTRSIKTGVFYYIKLYFLILFYV